MDTLGRINSFAYPSAKWLPFLRNPAEDRSRRLAVFADRAVEVGVREIAVCDEREGDRMVISSVEPDQVRRYRARKWSCAPSIATASRETGRPRCIEARLSHMTTSPGRQRWRAWVELRVASSISSASSALPSSLAQTLDRAGMGGDVERLPAVRRIAPNHSPAHRPATRPAPPGSSASGRSGRGNWRNYVYATRLRSAALRRVGQPVPGEPHRSKLRLSAIVREHPRRQHRGQRRRRLEGGSGSARAGWRGWRGL